MYIITRKNRYASLDLLHDAVKLYISLGKFCVWLVFNGIGKSTNIFTNVTKIINNLPSKDTILIPSFSALATAALAWVGMNDFIC